MSHGLSQKAPHIERGYPSAHDWHVLSSYPVFSATQISTFLDCERKWALRYILGLPDRKEDGPRDFGKKVHWHQDRWLRHGIKPPDTPTGRVMGTAIKWLPPPGMAWPELPFEWLPDGQPFALRGAIDCLQVHKDGVPWIEDTKVTGSNFKWAKSRDELREDVQATIYSAYAMHRFNADTIRCRWLYCLRTTGRPRPARPVDLGMGLEHVANRFGIVCEVGRRMVLALEQRVRPEDMPPRDACNKYGGCPYLDNGCGMTPQERFRIQMAENTPGEMTLEQKVAAHMAAMGQQLPAQPVNPPESQGQVPVQQVPPAQPAQTQAAMSAQGSYGGPQVVQAQPAQALPPSHPNPWPQQPLPQQPIQPLPPAQAPVQQPSLPMPPMPPVPPPAPPQQPSVQPPTQPGPQPACTPVMPLELPDAVKALELIAQGFQAAAQHLRNRADTDIPF